MGKSRYEPLVKLKKKSLDEAERDLITANNDVVSATERLNNAYETLYALSLPSQGSVHELSQANMMIHAQHLMINQCKETLEQARYKQHQKRELFNGAMIEFEKFNYLAVQELNAQSKKLKDQEAKLLDEIGTMTYKRERR